MLDLLGRGQTVHSFLFLFYFLLFVHPYPRIFLPLKSGCHTTLGNVSKPLAPKEAESWNSSNWGVLVVILDVLLVAGFPAI